MSRRTEKGIAILVLVLIVGLSACGGSPPDGNQPTATTPSPTATLPPSRYQVTEHKNVSYGPLAAEKLDLCQPLGATSSRPGVIIIHGGGWISEDKSSVHFQNRCTSLAALGFVVANIDYRLATATANGQVVMQDMWPAQLVDVQLAVRWMRAQAQQLGLDPTRICAAGSSAGAQLAVFLGVLATIHPGDEAHLYANQSPKVSCVVDNYGPIDLTKVSYANPLLRTFWTEQHVQFNRLARGFTGLLCLVTERPYGDRTGNTGHHRPPGSKARIATGSPKPSRPCPIYKL